jgi:cobalt-zinc-cadmium efflux system outer membrane protein
MERKMTYLSRSSSEGNRSRTIIISVLSIGLLFAVSAQASSTITLRKALEKTLQSNSELNLYPLSVRGAEAMQLQAEVVPSPTIEVQIENSLGNGVYDGFNSSEISLTYGQLIELGDKQKNRLQFATAKTRQVQKEYQLARLDVLAEASNRYYANLLLQQRLQLVERRIHIEEKALSIIKRRAKAGAVGEADVSKMVLRLGQSKFQKQNLNNQLKRAQMRLAAMWMEEPNFNRVSGDFGNLPKTPNRQMILSTIAKLPRMQLQFAMERLSNSKLNLARSNGKSDLSFAVGLKQHEQFNDQSLNVSFTMPLAFTNPNRGRIKAAEVAVERSIAESSAQKQRLKLMLLDIRHQLLSLNTQSTTITNQLLPQASKLLVEIEKGYQKGQYSVLQWIDAQTELFAIEHSMNDIHAQVFQQYLEIERITGQSLKANLTPVSGENP